MDIFLIHDIKAMQFNPEYKLSSTSGLRTDTTIWCHEGWDAELPESKLIRVRSGSEWLANQTYLQV